MIAAVPAAFAAIPAAAHTPTLGPPPAAPVTCDGGGISADLGQALQVVRWSPGWAYVTTGELGDASSLVRLAGDGWTRYTGFPSSICRGQAAADGVPATELPSFRPC
jgi:hypothetical protein